MAIVYKAGIAAKSEQSLKDAIIMSIENGYLLLPQWLLPIRFGVFLIQTYFMCVFMKKKKTFLSKVLNGSVY